MPSRKQRAFRQHYIGADWLESWNGMGDGQRIKKLCGGIKENGVWWCLIVVF